VNFSLPHAWTGDTFPFSSPREWQARALPQAVASLEAGERGVVRAIMGAGKAALAAELCYVSVPEERESIVVTAPTQALVRQLSDTIRDRIGKYYVGRYYADEKQPLRPIVVVCLDSLPKFFRELSVASRRVGLWIADEVHRTETETVDEALTILDPELRIGLTATPYLAKDSGALERWDRLVFEYGVKEALEDGVVVPWRLEHYTGAEASFGLACLSELARACELGPGVVNANTIADADNFARLARDYGVDVRTIHSGNTRDQNEKRLERLRLGEIDAVVHVSMLQEGVDLPWLRWLLLRRNTKSKVRFAQEVGRVLRATEGKTFATIFDPLELFASLKLTHEACLSGGAVDEALEDVDLLEEAADELLEVFEDESDETVEERVIRGLTPLEAYLRQVVVALDVAGVLEQKVAPRRMRKEDPTIKQIRYAKKLNRVPDPKIVRGLPQRHREILSFGVREAQRLNKGALSDLISILVGLRKSKQWPALADELAS